jgi:hypothetical protein
MVVAKPDIPSDIAHNYKQVRLRVSGWVTRRMFQVKVQWTEQLVATQKQKTQQIVKETEKQNALADADRQKAVMEVDIEKQVLQKEGDQNLSLLEAEHQQKLELVIKETEKQKAIASKEVSVIFNEQLRLTGETEADIKKEAALKEAEANLKLFTPDYIKLNLAQAITPNTKFFFSGEQEIISGLIAKVMN